MVIPPPLERERDWREPENGKMAIFLQETWWLMFVKISELLIPFQHKMFIIKNTIENISFENKKEKGNSYIIYYMYFWRRVVNAFHSSQCWGLVDASSFYNLGVDRFSSYFISLWNYLTWANMLFGFLLPYQPYRSPYEHTHIPFVADKW